MLYCFGGSVLSSLMLAEPPIAFLAKGTNTLLASSVWYLMFYCPQDIFYRCFAFLPLRLLVAGMKEVTRTWKITAGVAHADSHFKDAWLVMVAVGWARGAGGGLMSNLEQLARGVWKPETNELLKMSYGVKNQTDVMGRRVDLYLNSSLMSEEKEMSAFNKDTQVSQEPKVLCLLQLFENSTVTTPPSTNPSSPAFSSCPTVTICSDQLKVPSVATSNSLFLEDLPGELESLASPAIFSSADDGSAVCPLVIRAEVKDFCACRSSFFKQCLEDMNRNLPASLL
ncbi:trimeric intracellular cation channel type B isoform 3-T5 [Rhynochetos jubatus]